MQTTRIIIVDDDRSMCEFVQVLARRTIRDAQLIGHTSAASALREVEAGEVDLLIIDLDMLDTNGFELVWAVRAKTPVLPIIMVSGSDDAVRPEDHAGINRFVPKDRLNCLLPGAITSVLQRELAVH